MKIVEAAPPGYDLMPKAVDEDGAVIVGVLQPKTPGGITDEGTMFRWSADSGLALLTANIAETSNVWQMDVSNNGLSVEFFCPDRSSIPTCPGSPSAPTNWPAKARVWTQAKGIQILGANISRPFDYIVTAGDFTRDVISKTGPIATDYTTQTQTAQFHIGVVDNSGSYFPFKGVPELVAHFGGPEGRNLAPLDRLSDIVMNRSVTLISPGGVWDNEGNLRALPKTSFGCVLFFPKEITNGGDYFGYGSCPPPVGASMLHLDASGSQTISDWLRRHGVPNDLGNSTTAVNSVSDDGKTIVGIGSEQPAFVGQLLSDPHAKLELTSDPVANGSSVQPYEFIAHFP